MTGLAAETDNAAEQHSEEWPLLLDVHEHLCVLPSSLIKDQRLEPSLSPGLSSVAVITSNNLD